MPRLLATAFVAVFTHCAENSSNPVEEQQEIPDVNYHCADTVEVYSPKAGEVYAVGDTLEIRFCGDTAYQTLVAVSFDDGIIWHDLAKSFPFSPEDTTAWSTEPGVIKWPIPSLVGDPDGEDTFETVSEECVVVVHRLNDLRYKAEGRFAIREKE